MRTPEQVYNDYQNDVARWKERQAHYIDIKPLNMNELLFIKTRLHPTAKAESKEMSKKIMEFIHSKRIVTAEEIYEEFGYSDKPVLRRLKVLREVGLVRRESKKFYIATPRLDEAITKRWHERVCS